jgi:hypothetical protein
MISGQAHGDRIRRFESHVPHCDVEAFQLAQEISIAAEGDYSDKQPQSTTDERIGESISDRRHAK